MDILESVKMASTTLLANKLRSSLTMLGIIIGNASVIAMIGIGEGAQTLANKQFQSLGPNTLFIVPGSPGSRGRVTTTPRTLVLQDAQAIAQQVRAVQEVAPEINNRITVSYRNQSATTTVIGTTPNYTKVRNFEIEEGRFFNDFDLKRSRRVAVLAPYLANKIFDNQNPIGQKIRIQNTTFEVIGLTVSKGSSFGNNSDDTVFIPINTMYSRLVGRTSPYGINISLISASAKDENSISAAEFQITNLLRRRHKIVREDDFTIQTQKNLLEISNTITGALTTMLAAIASISLFVGGIGIMNIMLVSVTERTQEIGLRKAIGATQTDILLQFIIEAVILSVAGGLIGIAIGGGSIILVGIFTPLESTISLSAVVLAASVSGGIGLFFGVVPARRAAKLDPMVALRTA
ncbi:ABC transporter permease [Cuspidothrix issatschenkoi LEGE 03284]|uniref:ABC transporter permease n=1 Tax=Cuspidothrix issatschenkoi TaxID=230752 RepID=UPI00187E7880|nr:ABC transporter permease [Cuspidothrix issatschenkoi]MBE9232203.1 ABC transporter permease [Cuspidothrix issatschenkoi LEGE 03284]